MFVSNELVQLVFADESDTFYGEDLTELDLEQYLWLRLHRSGYKAVYFLRQDAQRKDGFVVRSMSGDRKCRPFDADQQKGLKKFFGKQENELGKWMQAQLQDKNDPAAFVCSMGDFCAVASRESWEPVLRGIAEDRKRRGILVLTAPAETADTAELLLGSPVFGLLKDSAILDARGERQQDLFGYLSRRKTRESCVFLNAFTDEGREGIEGLVRNMELTRSGPVLTQEERAGAARYLSAYLSSPRMQKEDHLFDYKYPGAYLPYRELHRFLSQEGKWNALLHRAKNADPDTLAGGKPPLVFRSRDGEVGDCIERVFSMRRSLVADPLVGEEWDRVLERLMSPDTGPENKTLSECMDRLTRRLATADRRDAESCRCILEVLRTFCRELCKPGLEEDPDRVNCYAALEKSAGLYADALTRLRDLDTTIHTLSAQSNPAAAASRTMAVAAKKQMEAYRDKVLLFIRTRIDELSIPDSIKGIGSMLEDLEELDTEFQAARQTEQAAVPAAGFRLPEEESGLFRSDFISEPEPEPETEPETESGPETGEEDTETTRRDLYNAMPPRLNLDQ